MNHTNYKNTITLETNETAATIWRVEVFNCKFWLATPFNFHSSESLQRNPLFGMQTLINICVMMILTRDRRIRTLIGVDGGTGIIHQKVRVSCPLKTYMQTHRLQNLAHHHNSYLLPNDFRTSARIQSASHSYIYLYYIYDFFHNYKYYYWILPLNSLFFASQPEEFAGRSHTAERTRSRDHR